MSRSTDTATSDPGSQELDARRWAALATVLVASFMGILDVFIVNVAAPSIQHGLHASFGELQFVIAGYVLAYAVGLVTGGRIGDAVGRKRAFILGTACFTLASAACAAAPNPILLIAFRVIQGLAAALMLPQVLSIIQVSFPEEERTQALGFYGATIGLASITGQLIGGLLITVNIASLGWRAVFLVNVGGGRLASASAGPSVNVSRAPKRSRLDLGGAALLAASLIALMLPLVQDSNYWLIDACPILLVAFIFHEHRLIGDHGSPLVPLGLFKQRPFSVGLATVLLFYSGNAALFLILAYYLQGGLGLSPLGSGLTFVPLGIGFAIASLTVKRCLPQLGARILAIGALIMAAGLGLIAAIIALGASNAEQPYLLAPALFIAGAGQGTVAAPLIATVLERVAGQDAGAGSGVLLTATQIANALGVTALGAVFAAVLGANPEAAHKASTTQYTSAFQTTTLLMVVLAIGTLLVSLLIPTTGQSRLVGGENIVRRILRRWRGRTAGRTLTRTGG